MESFLHQIRVQHKIPQEFVNRFLANDTALDLDTWRKRLGPEYADVLSSKWKPSGALLTPSHILRLFSYDPTRILPCSPPPKNARFVEDYNPLLHSILPRLQQEVSLRHVLCTAFGKEWLAKQSCGLQKTTFEVLYAAYKDPAQRADNQEKCRALMRDQSDSSLRMCVDAIMEIWALEKIIKYVESWNLELIRIALAPNALLEYKKSLTFSGAPDADSWQASWSRIGQVIDSLPHWLDHVLRLCTSTMEGVKSMLKEWAACVKKRREDLSLYFYMQEEADRAQREYERRVQEIKAEETAWHCARAVVLYMWKAECESVPVENVSNKKIRLESPHPENSLVADLIIVESSSVVPPPTVIEEQVPVVAPEPTIPTQLPLDVAPEPIVSEPVEKKKKKKKNG